jgi:hypothetical protein
MESLILLYRPAIAIGSKLFKSGINVIRSGLSAILISKSKDFSTFFVWIAFQYRNKQQPN